MRLLSLANATGFQDVVVHVATNIVIGLIELVQGGQKPQIKVLVLGVFPRGNPHSCA
jgi:hypothetical protein